jgi:hypothetical protein
VGTCVGVSYVQGGRTPVPITIGSYSLPGVTVDSQYQVSEAPCPAGTYCLQGVSNPCPPGVYGSAQELSTPACSGQCSPGYVWL